MLVALPGRLRRRLRMHPARQKPEGDKAIDVRDPVFDLFITLLSSMRRHPPVPPAHTSPARQTMTPLGVLYTGGRITTFSCGTTVTLECWPRTASSIFLFGGSVLG